MQADALPSESGNNPPVYGIHGASELPPPPPVPNRADEFTNNSDDEETESVSEWELERQKQKVGVLG